MYFSFQEQPYIAIIGDIKESKKLKDRFVVQETLKSVLQEINEAYQEEIAAKFIITLGDEFQGLLKSGGKTMQIIQEIEREMHPVKIRFGIGFGTITTDINIEMALGADGPAFHMARKAIETIKDNEKKRKVTSSDVRIEAAEENDNTVMMLNTILALLSAIKENWSERQREIIWDMLKYQDGQTNVAKRFQIKQPAVQKNLANGNYYVYKEGIDTITLAIGEIGGEYV